ncbi:unnamed protein product [Cylindrotheca closterium]|uniref:5'-3' exoribonuclease n=1 Tax=Cylindrotheca closterium TaxID=2856 RepID=A0AAD2FL27_9STRA|nr:unnamed protein product [Cylindrotheca closterium]
MGVPAFFRWLTEKYPKILEDVLEERVKLLGGEGSTRIQFDSTRPNPSGLECDNLYIDMNGIIHPCSHPEHGPQPTTEEEMYENVCLYVDRLFRAMRPRKLLYLAVDGVAPRAKMNQQRARRFRSAQEAREHLEVEHLVREELSKMGQKVPPAKKAWDSNVITPGTPFMLRLSEYIRFYVRKRMSTDKAWQNIRVIFSDASIPGEGEHKIMSHIRLQRSQPGYSPNLVHVLHGLDADLIMLALATHEAHFYISREEVLFGRKSQNQAEMRQLETGFRDKQRVMDEEAGDFAMQILENKQKPFVRVSIPVLREYLAADFASCLAPGRLPFPPSLERLIDDIVFLCFFVGNDFLPHLPSLDIRDGALDYLFNVYKRTLPTLGDYITNHGGNVNLSHVDVILAEVGAIEDYVFTMKHDNEMRDRQRREDMKARRKQAGGRSLDAPPTFQNQPNHAARGRAAKILEREESMRTSKEEKGNKKIKPSHMKSKENLEAALSLKRALENPSKITADNATPSSDGGGATDHKVVPPIKEEEDQAMDASEISMRIKAEPSRGTKRSLDESKNEGDAKIGVVGDAEKEFDGGCENDDTVASSFVEDASPEVLKAFKDRVKTKERKQLDAYSQNVEDKVRLHEKGWKNRYYTDKCKADDVAAHGGREHLFRSYVLGLCWVMKYYYDGCPSWKWYYPFHYAPFASDLRNIERFECDVRSLEISTPFNPVEQLMAVLPSDSSHAVPKEARWLMSDPESPIIDFYPTEVPVDPNGKAMPWLWVVLLPFIEEDRLLDALTPTLTKWTKEELLCNSRGLDDGYLFIHFTHTIGSKIRGVLQDSKTAKSPKTRLTDQSACPGFVGAVRPPLSNEIHPVGDDTTVSCPAASQKAEFTSLDNLFTEPLVGNDVLCVAFTEPLKLSHKSIMIPGAVPPPPSLTAQDKNIGRPRLNRGGGTIANMGISNGQSYKSGYGSMNIGSYERDLANRNGRGNQMYQAVEELAVIPHSKPQDPLGKRDKSKQITVMLANSRSITSSSNTITVNKQAKIVNNLINRTGIQAITTSRMVGDMHLMVTIGCICRTLLGVSRGKDSIFNRVYQTPAVITPHRILRLRK